MLLPMPNKPEKLSEIQKAELLLAVKEYLTPYWWNLLGQHFLAEDIEKQNAYDRKSKNKK